MSAGKLVLDQFDIDERRPTEPGVYLVWDQGGPASTAFWDSSRSTFRNGAVGRTVRFYAGPVPDAPKIEDLL